MDKNKLIQLAKQMIREDGLINLSREGLCQRAKIPKGSFAHRAGMSFTEFIEEIQNDSNDPVNITVKKSRVNPTMRRTQLLGKMAELCLTYNYDKVTRKDLADHCGVSLGLINHYFGTLQQIRNAIIRYAIKNNIEKITNRGVEIKDPRVNKK